MNVVAVETWLQEHAGLDASTLGAGVVARAARDRLETLRCARVEDYLALLEQSPEERHTLIDRVIVPETWFFRDRAALEALARHVVDTWGPAHPGAVFHVLSIPCSTGEEPYSLAMAFALAGWPLAQLRIDAVDISRDNIARARAGIYGRNSFRGDNLLFRDTCFEVAAQGGWRVADRVRTPVRFEQGNLLAPDFALGRGLYDAVFCRNLLIYFDRPTQARAIQALARLLAPEGWIAVGPAEPVLLFEHGFAALRVPAAFLLQRAAPVPPLRPPPSAPKRKMPVVPSPAKPRPPSPPAAATKLLAAALDSADTPAAILALADAGRLQEAAARGAALLARTAGSPALFYTLAVVADATGDVARAEEFYRKTLYLEPNHADALSHLALLAEKKGDTRGARQLRLRAKRLAPEQTR